MYILVEGCRSLPAWETKTQPGQSLPSGRAGNEKPIPCRVARDWKIELGPTMADMWTHRKFVSARIPFFSFFLPHLIAIENCDQDKIFNPKNIETNLCRLTAPIISMLPYTRIYAQNFILQFMSIMTMVQMNASRMYLTGTVDVR